MDAPFDLYPRFLHCGIHRDSFDRLPVELSHVEWELLDTQPPPELAAGHCAGHLVSFARHVADIVDDPIRRVEVNGQVFHSILGVVVYHRAADQTFSTALWQRPRTEGESWLTAFLPRETPILDFPRTDLWRTTLHQTLVREAQQRMGNREAGKHWADWAWALICERVIVLTDHRRLRARIRGGLAPDQTTISLMRWFRRFDGGRYRHTVSTYNRYRRERDAFLQLRQCSPLFPLLSRWLTLPEIGAGGSAEASARLKQACLTQGVKLAQWRILAAPGAPLLPAFQSFVREFMGDWHREPVEDFLGVIALLEPTRGIEPEVLRVILGMVGTQANPPDSYAASLAPVRNTLRHIIRLIEAGKAPKSRDQRDAELHEICAWVADTAVRKLLPQQRRQGWAFMIRSARQHSEQRQRALKLESLQWSVPRHPLTIGDFTVVPLTCGRDLWEESVDMRHCADLYGARCMAGTTLVLSVRDAGGRRKATLALERKKGSWLLTHAVGRANRQLGKEFEELIEAMLSVLNVVDSSRLKSMKGPSYRIDVLDNYDHGRSRSENSFRSAEAALGEARRICKGGLSSRDEAGRDTWLLFGETPIIVTLDGADPIQFDALEYINQLCNCMQPS
jgi:hypothetical protein